MSMLAALALSIAQLGDRRVLRLLARSIGITLLLLAILAIGGWWALDLGLRDARIGGDVGGDIGGDALRGAFALIAVIIAGWLAWRLIAFAVLQVYADEVVAVVEARHYPAAFATAEPLGRAAELRRGLAGAARALGWNLAALPIALALIVTGVGTPILFWAVNAVLLGRELVDMVASRHRRSGTTPALPAAERLVMGGIVAGLTFVPVVNLLAPFLGAALATHLTHRRARSLPYAT